MREEDVKTALVALVEAEGLTQKQLAQRMGSNQGWVQRHLAPVDGTHKRPGGVDFDDASRIADACGYEMVVTFIKRRTGSQSSRA